MPYHALCVAVRARMPVSCPRLGVHTGTHVDAPAHFLAEERRVIDLPLAALIGEARVIEIPESVRAIGLEHVTDAIVLMFMSVNTVILAINARLLRRAGFWPASSPRPTREPASWA